MSFQGFQPSPGASPKGKMPKSPAKRRQFLRETEDDTGHMLIEQYIYRRDRYRSTSLVFPYPLPMTEKKVSQALETRMQADTTLRPAIFNMLEQHGIQPLTVQLRSQSKPNYPNGGDMGSPAVQILVNAGEGTPLNRWSAARRDIMAMLDDHGFSGVEVEIQDPDRYYQPSLFPIPPKHPAVAIYKAVRKDLLGQIQDTIGSAWQALSLYNVGRTANVKKPTVVLMVDPLSQHDWNILAASLEAIVGRQQGNSGPKLQVEIVPGTWGQNPPASGMPGQSFLESFSTHPLPGTSIGVGGERGGGTLGGYFVMRSPTKQHNGFLTNSHVVAPPSTSPIGAIQEFVALGLPYTAPEKNHGRTWLQYFAEKDVEATVVHGTEVIKELKANITDIEAQERTYDERGRLTAEKKAEDQSSKDNLKTTIQETKESLRAAKAMPRLLGRTILASGRALTNNRKTLDYAFVEGPRGNTQLPPRAMFAGARAYPNNLGINQTLTFAEGSKYRAFSSIQPGQWYFKLGRTTGLTAGVCNGVETWIKPAYQHTLWDANGKLQEIRRAGKKLQVDKKTGLLKRGEDGKPKEEEGDDSFYYASEWVIINGSTDPSSWRTQEQFCNPGDSGSLIIDCDGKVAGILWGDLMGWCGPMDSYRLYIGAGLVTDINDVKTAMRMALGWPATAIVDVLRFP